MKKLIGKLKDIMIKAAERDKNYRLSKKLKRLRKKEIEDEEDSFHGSLRR